MERGLRARAVDCHRFCFSKAVRRKARGCGAPPCLEPGADVRGARAKGTAAECRSRRGAAGVAIARPGLGRRVRGDVRAAPVPQAVPRCPSMP